MQQALRALPAAKDVQSWAVSQMTRCGIHSPVAVQLHGGGHSSTNLQWVEVIELMTNVGPDTALGRGYLFFASKVILPLTARSTKIKRLLVIHYRN